ncbi:proteoglycan 4 isoform X4 [Drosophila pseudoobscura]|uniref:Proteoglycan 4 isoform X4 n=1 Tax=Drosophila pseudoobscura pseudoobscura TaxID=46245 RepID=A0A6I8UDX5_DROPS|nr:proteoglycan 4 isoform X4 [Drosophila pseudoobscura]
MVLDIKMCRFDNVPWGFRLVGGADYDYPLTVVKVTEGSIADEAGLRVEDIIVRINDTAAMPLTHDEAHRLIMNSGSVFYFGVYRELEEDVYECPKRFPTSESSLTKSPTPTPPLSLSPTPSLLRLAEAANARTPELWSEPVPPVAEERRQAMSEVHSEDNREDGGARAGAGAGAGAGALPEEAPNDGRLYLPELPDRPCSALSERAEIKLVEEEIAAVLSGETEVLKEHSVLGLFPKPGVCMASDVLRSLNEEVTKTKLEKDKENRKWSTFLQRPDRPVPKSKQQLEAERRAANAYKVTIVKSAPRGTSPMPETKPAPKEATPPEPEPVKEEEPPKDEEKQKEEEEEPLPTDSEVPNLEQLPGSDPQEQGEEQQEKADAPKEVSDGLTEAEAPPVASDESTEPGSPSGGGGAAAAAETETPASPASPPAPVPVTPPKTEEEQALERQLADVQKQLAALSTLPSTIQSTLDAVTKQLADLLPTFKLQQQPQSMPQIDEGLGEEGEADGDGKPGSQTAAGEMEDAGKAVSISGADKPLGPCENNEDRCDANDLEVAEISRSTDDNRQADQKAGKTHEREREREREREQEQELSEEQSFKKQKKHDVIEELEEHLVRKNNPRRSKRAFGPLVPSSERPLVLPGGRRWYRPKDAYNDEFIAETLSAQAELITGSTLGVNFMKYQKPERKIDLNRSEVYKYLNPHLDRAPVRGIEVRAPLVAAESDIRQSLQS